ncbi:hypothetical protein S1OALGB6SA_1519 [Olavius algarvensis spirochete endosymbiont]|uniref:hypothetical protein n=1 Tax=Olavius algarvensis spirochete endosymbiont TaxID=260710 RepID=UPI000F19FAE1|nr:hypothetical protein [Olavius algarvensis spirochete endosymbiont]VDB00437.1 hypothetical protein S1OALGB6SA_1519 [Olavius algarvensis spirochete endosymbiont]
MEAWFEGSNEIECSLERIKSDLENPGEHFTGVIKLIPNMSEAELVEQGEDWVTIKQKEILTKRTNIVKRMETERMTVEFDEDYRVGRIIRVNVHALSEFTSLGTRVRHRAVISNVEAPGIFGFFYRKFASADTGKILLEAYKRYFEMK